MILIAVFDIAALAITIAVAVFVAGTAVYEHFSPPHAPRPDSIDD